MLEKITQNCVLRRVALPFIFSANMLACLGEQTSPKIAVLSGNDTTYDTVQQQSNDIDNTKQYDQNDSYNQDKYKSDVSSWFSETQCEKKAYFLDKDKDGYGDKNNVVYDCIKPQGYIEDNSDVDDNDPNSYPNAPELCDGKDNNGNGVIDDGIQYTKYYQDSDGDGYGNPNFYIVDCKQSTGYVTNNADCNDSNTKAYPGALEICDNEANNCIAPADKGLLKIVACDVYNFNGNGTKTIDCVKGQYVDLTSCVDPDECTLGETKFYYTGLEAMKGVGVCAAGVKVCEGSPAQWNIVKGKEEKLLSVEKCNSIDDDCDGKVDNGFNIGQKCFKGIGECKKESIYKCNSNGDGTFCDVVASKPSMAVDTICDGKDQACLGEPDKGLEKIIACGLNGKGKQKQSCVNALWANQGTCYNDPDECKNDGIENTKNIDCGINNSGIQKLSCVSGKWIKNGECIYDCKNISDFTGYDGQPAIWENSVVFISERDWFLDGGKNRDVYLYKIKSGKLTNLSNSLLIESDPKIMNGKVAYSYYDPKAKKDPVIILDIKAQTTVNLDLSSTPALGEEWVAYTKYNSANQSKDIFVRHLLLNIEKNITNHPAQDINPVISKNKVLFESDKDFNKDIFRYDFGAKNVVNISLSPSSKEELPKVAGDFAIFGTDNGTNVYTADLYVYHLPSGLKKKIFNNDFIGNFVYNSYAVSENGTIIFETPNNTIQLYKAYKPAPINTLIISDKGLLTSSQFGNVSHPVIWENKIAFVSLKNENNEVYVCDIAPKCVSGAETKSCGYNNKGTVARECVNSHWSNWECNEIDSCTNGTIEEKVCGSTKGECAAGKQAIVCENGKWKEGECTGAISGTYYQDKDNDGYGNPNVSISDCTKPGGYVKNNSDCDDTDAATFPDAKEQCDGKVNGCQSTIADAGLEHIISCGFNGKGKQKKACVNASWTNQGECYDDLDKCKYGNTKEEKNSCGFENVGTQKYYCQNSKAGNAEWLTLSCVELYGCISPLSQSQLQQSGKYKSLVSGRYYVHPTNVMVNTNETIEGTASGTVQWYGNNPNYTAGPDTKPGYTWGLKYGCKDGGLFDLGSVFNKKIPCSGELYFYVPDGPSSSLCALSYYADNGGGFEVLFEIKK